METLNNLIEKQENRTFKNKDIEEVYNLAKKDGCRIYTFKSNDKFINQIFIENKELQVGSCSVYFSGINFSTIHKSKRGSGIGTGFGCKDNFQDPTEYKQCFDFAPKWVGFRDRENVTKYKGFEDYLINQLGILKYYEL